MNPVPIFVLPASILSVQDVEGLIVEIKQYSTWLSHTNVKQRLSITVATGSVEQSPPVMTPAAQIIIEDTIDRKDNSIKDLEALEVLVADLENIRDNAARLTITLAAPPTGELKRTLASWCRQNIGPDVLVSFQFNSTLLGGMVVRYGSHIFDWSFRRKVLDKRGAFPALLRKGIV